MALINAYHAVAERSAIQEDLHIRYCNANPIRVQ